MSTCTGTEYDGEWLSFTNAILNNDTAFKLSGEASSKQSAGDCSDCLQFAQLDFINDECECGEKYEGCVTLEISNTSTLVRDILGVYYAIDLTFDYTITVSESVSSDSYVTIEVSSESWSGTTSTAVSILKGTDTHLRYRRNKLPVLKA